MHSDETCMMKETQATKFVLLERFIFEGGDDDEDSFDDNSAEGNSDEGDISVSICRMEILF